MSAPASTGAAARPAPAAAAPDARAAAWLAPRLSGARVLLLDGDPALAALLARAGASVEQRPPATWLGAPRAVATTSPAAVVLSADLAAAPDPPALLAAAVEAAGAAGALVLFRNRSSGAAVLGAAAGRPPPRGLVPAEAEAWIAAAGLSVAARDALPAEGAPSLAADADARLRALLAEVDPASAHEWLAWTVRRGPAARALVPGLLSVVMRHHDLARMDLLDQAVFSLAAQAYRPVEIVVATQCRVEGAKARIAELLERHRRVGGYAFRIVRVEADGDARGRLVNAGIAAARGQYLAFLDDDDVVYPGHYARLVGALARGTAAWAAARVRVGRFTRAPDGALRCTSKSDLPAPASFDRLGLMRSNYVVNHAYVVDRTRIGAFELAYSEETARGEDYALVLRLASLFEPEWIAEPGSEYRLRDDGTNVNPLAPLPAALRARRDREWREGEDAVWRIRERIPVVASAAEWARWLDAAGIPASPHAPALRYRLADALNGTMKRVLPGVHWRARAWLGRRLGRGEP